MAAVAGAVSAASPVVPVPGQGTHSSGASIGEEKSKNRFASSTAKSDSE